MWGLLEYKPQWTLSPQGWLLFLVILITVATIVVTQVQPFLAMQAPVLGAEALLVEGWIGDPVIKGAVQEFEQGNYNLILTTGTEIYRGSFLSEYKNYAELTAATLEKLGVPPEKIVVLASPNPDKDRTAAAAVTVKKWLLENYPQLRAINIYSFDVHTRRSWWIYHRVLGESIKVGAIAYPNTYYDAQKWWESSAGFRSVTEEAIAYFYARFLWYYK